VTTTHSVAVLLYCHQHRSIDQSCAATKYSRVSATLLLYIDLHLVKAVLQRVCLSVYLVDILDDDTAGFVTVIDRYCSSIDRSRTCCRAVKRTVCLSRHAARSPTFVSQDSRIEIRIAPYVSRINVRPDFMASHQTNVFNKDIVTMPLDSENFTNNLQCLVIYVCCGLHQKRQTG